MAVGCPSCGKENADDALFCKSCGSKMPRTGGGKCPKCGLTNPDYVTYCGSCGTDLKSRGDSTGQPANVSMHATIPPPAYSAAVRYDTYGRPSKERLMAQKINLRSVFVHEPQGVQELHVNIDELVTELDKMWTAIDRINLRLDALEKKKLV